LPQAATTPATLARRCAPGTRRQSSDRGQSLGSSSVRPSVPPTARACVASSRRPTIIVLRRPPGPRFCSESRVRRTLFLARSQRRLLRNATRLRVDRLPFAQHRYERRDSLRAPLRCLHVHRPERQGKTILGGERLVGGLRLRVGADRGEEICRRLSSWSCRTRAPTDHPPSRPRPAP